MKTTLQKQLAEIAPLIAIETIWEHDLDAGDIRKECDGMENVRRKDWQAWWSEIKATTIVRGELVEASAYMGGTWEKSKDLPEFSNPTISGYEPQMTEEALLELYELATSAQVKDQCQRACMFLKEFMRREYDEQTAQPTT